jgi:hypothetical protein
LRTAGRDPGDRTPAPGSLRLIQALVNTLNAEAGLDLLATRAEAAEWLVAAGLLAGQLAARATALTSTTAGTSVRAGL